MEKHCISTDGRHLICTYTAEEVTPYINWVYFFHAWGLPSRTPPMEAEAAQLHQEALHLLQSQGKDLRIQGIFRLCRAQADGDDLQIEGVRFPLLRQQSPDPSAGACLCLSDFIRPLSCGQPDHIGLFAATVKMPQEEAWKEQDPYVHLLIQTLSDRLAEAAAEKMHQQVRKEYWGYAPHEDLPVHDLLHEKFQGIRPAVGYPSLPDQSVIFILDELLGLKRIGITLTEHGAMLPHASVCGLMMAHPKARHFKVGKIGTDQLNDYAQRRGLPATEVQKFLRM